MSEVNALEAAKQQLKEAQEQLAEVQRRNEELLASFDERVERAADVRASELFWQAEAVREDAAEREKPKVLKRPTTYLEYASYDTGTQSKLMDLYGGVDLVTELLDKQRRERAALAAEESRRKALAANKSIGPKHN